LASGGRLRRLSIVWQDGAADIRDGEVKSYDPLVTVFDDVLPHVLPMVQLFQEGSARPVSLDVRRGGAEISIKAQLVQLEVTLLLARNGERRRRTVLAHTDAGDYSLDFSGEPGLINGPGILDLNADPLWDSAPRPLRSMLSAFLAAAAGGPLDARLSPDKALMSAAFADAVRDQYRARQAAELEARIGDPPDVALTYALQETGLTAEWPTIDSTAKLRAMLGRHS
jgi:hypothetical protein